MDHDRDFCKRTCRALAMRRTTKPSGAAMHHACLHSRWRDSPPKRHPVSYPSGWTSKFNRSNAGIIAQVSEDQRSIKGGPRVVPDMCPSATRRPPIIAKSYAGYRPAIARCSALPSHCLT